MQDEELRKPLKPRSRWRRLWEKRPSPSRAAMALAGVAFGALVVWSVMTPAPRDSRPMATASIPPVDKTATGSLTPPPPVIIRNGTASRPRPPVNESKPVNGASGEGKDYTVIPPPPVDIPDATNLPRTPREARRRQMAALGLPVDNPLPPAPLRPVTERTSQGPLPRISRSGKKPWQVYARPAPRKALASGKPRVAIVIGGLGINASLTHQAVDNLPGIVTLAYAPYGRHLQKQVNMARRKGHEVLLQLPMEPWGYPAVNPGPKTLLVSATPQANLASLRWILSRAAGYVGVINYTGQKLLSQGEALAPILHEIRNRGLIFLDDGETSRSLLPSLASVIDLPARQAALRIDAQRDQQAIRAALDRLKERAKAQGAAIGTGTAFTVTLNTLRDWMNEQMPRGEIVFVPLTALYKIKERGR